MDAGREVGGKSCRCWIAAVIPLVAAVPLALTATSCRLNPSANNGSTLPPTAVEQDRTAGAETTMAEGVETTASSRTQMPGAEVAGAGPQHVPTPTMSPRVRRIAASCEDWRVGPEIEPGRIVSARYEDGIWITEAEGLWEFHGRGVSTSPPKPGESNAASPTREPWRDIQFVTRCTQYISAGSGFVGESSSGPIITATPPS